MHKNQNRFKGTNKVQNLYCIESNTFAESSPAELKAILQSNSIDSESKQLTQSMFGKIRI